MELQDIIQDLHALEERMRAYERKYGITSHDFYELYQAGLLDDEGFEKTQEFTRWASAYEMKLECFDRPNLPFLIEEIEHDLLGLRIVRMSTSVR
jgi:hypothetical protein